MPVDIMDKYKELVFSSLIFIFFEIVNIKGGKLMKTVKTPAGIFTINKVKIPSAYTCATEQKIEYISENIKYIVYISAISGDGRDELTKAVEKIAGTQNFNPSEGVLSNERQRIAVKNALDSVVEAMNALECGMTFDAVTVSIEDAISHLLELTGERTSDEVVDRVFHNFCVGK